MMGEKIIDLNDRQSKVVCSNFLFLKSRTNRAKNQSREDTTGENGNRKGRVCSPRGALRPEEELNRTNVSRRHCRVATINKESCEHLGKKKSRSRCHRVRYQASLGFPPRPQSVRPHASSCPRGWKTYRHAAACQGSGVAPMSSIREDNFVNPVSQEVRRQASLKH